VIITPWLNSGKSFCSVSFCSADRIANKNRKQQREATLLLAEAMHSLRNELFNRLQQRQNRLGQLIGAPEDGSTSLDQHLVLGEVGDFLSEIRVAKHEFSVYGIFQGRPQVICRGFQRVLLEGSQTASKIGYLIDGGVDNIEGVLRLAGRSDINIVEAAKLVPLNGNAERARIYLANPERSRLVSVCSDLEYQ